MNNILKYLVDVLCRMVYICLPIRRLNRFLKDKRSTLYAYWVRNSFKSCPPSVRFGKIGMLHDPEYISIGEKCGFQDYLFADTFEEAVLTAVKLAEPGEAVLLSPACASWDMFPSYEVRGEKFKEIVNSL